MWIFPLRWTGRSRIPCLDMTCSAQQSVWDPRNDRVHTSPDAEKAGYESIKALSETDQTEDLKKFDVPTLVLHGEGDQIVPVKDSAKKSARLMKGAKEIYYPGAPHGLTATHQDQVNADLLAFLRS